MYYNALRFFTAYNLLDNGVSNLLGLQTLRQGTSLYNYCKIQIEGAQPTFGASGMGSESEGNNRCRGKIYVCKDTIDEAWVDQGKMFSDREGNLHNDWFLKRKRYNGESKPYPLTGRQIFWFQRYQSSSTRPYALNATYSLFKRLPFFRSSSIFNEHSSGCSDNAAFTQRAMAVSVMIGILIVGNLTPQVKFHFTDQQIKENIKTGRFRDDPLLTVCPEEMNTWNQEKMTFFNGFVTDKAIENSHLGVSGSLRQGLNADLFKNMKNHPYKVLYGTACLAGSGFLCRSLYRDIMFSSKSSSVSLSLSRRTVRLLKRSVIISGMLLHNAWS